ncbi:PAPA-1-domain-containing protein [Dothidotthia symphoricarpi CBS 119687]|uniref:PAPA-1-domain-containing protein n=1 Tax=Dothidotthia symphoricarpi CBS 119687 TaxID=1392245 RepID=A0A6A6AKQ4_9PLEO|nr:PAPA-1-domain-containing protein [Dothidotthia symphoricarpi CBS 119687]KAF2131021.1 PAPA-1-domain-containing protein [Dothidotthia symphoricarpi CBS 119687]
MTERATKRLRRISTEYQDSGDGTVNSGYANSAPPPAPSTRPRRGVANQTPAAVVIQRSSPEERRQSIHLTVKSSPGRLRQATSGPPVAKASVSRQNIVSGKRASRNSRVVQEADSEDEDEDEDEAEEADAMDLDDDEEEGDVDADADEDDDMDAEGDEDDDVDDSILPNIVVSTKQSIPVKPALKLTKAQDAVEAKEMGLDDDDDDELSDPDSDLEGEEEDAEGEDEDAEGEDDDDEMVAANDDDVEMDSDEDMSRDQTPDLSKLTRRQRALVNEDSDGGLMALSNEAQKKKHFTAEENAMRRAEMARRRKNLSEKRLEEEKADTINRLLKKQPPKRGRKSMGITESGQDEDLEVDRANPLFVRYVQNAKGTQLAVPDEWLQAPVGSLFAGPSVPSSKNPFSGRMVEEVA